MLMDYHSVLSETSTYHIQAMSFSWPHPTMKSSLFGMRLERNCVIGSDN